MGDTTSSHRSSRESPKKEVENSTIFSRIIAGEIEAEKLFENSHLIVIKDIYPVAPVHLLLIPKKVIASLQEMEEEDLFLLPEIIRVAQQMAKKMHIDKTGYRLITNCGKDSGQEILHLHFHLLGGKKLSNL